MSQDIRIKKGLNINLVGAAEQVTDSVAISSVYSVNPPDFHGVIPKLTVKVGAKVKAGEPLFFSKENDAIQFVSPVSGEVIEIERGAKRRVLSVKVKADGATVFQENAVIDVAKADAEVIKQALLSSGCWPFVKQRPYDVIANPATSPKAIFISGYASAPLANDYDYSLKGKDAQLQTAVSALKKLTDGTVHVTVGKNSDSPLSKLQDVTVHTISGPHPAGNVSTQIAHIDPINKGELVWVVTPQDLVIIGETLSTGRFNAERTVAVAGSSVTNPKYYTVTIGAAVSDVLKVAGLNGDNVRVISGNVLTGKAVGQDGALGYYDNEITVIPEGNDYELFGWNKPVFDKVSITRALTFSWLTPNKKYDLNTNTNGEHRGFVLTGKYEEVCPLDIYPMQLLKSCMYKDLDEMEQLGMYEVAPEDFALTEFVCVSKQPHQEIIREGLDLMYKEIG